MPTPRGLSSTNFGAGAEFPSFPAVFDSSHIPCSPLGSKVSVPKNLFDTLTDCEKSSEGKQLAPVGVHRYDKA